LALWRLQVASAFVTIRLVKVGKAGFFVAFNLAFGSFLLFELHPFSKFSFTLITSSLAYVLNQEILKCPKTKVGIQVEFSVAIFILSLRPLLQV
jgi:hypothetical protein